jgi:shikimate dehydrogenase
MDRYAVIGHPVAHSLSPRIHSLFAEQTDQTLSYGRIEAPLTGFRETVSDFFNAGGRGCNVTVPFKGDAAEWVDVLSSDADFAGAVNTIVVEAEGGSVGHNTDGPGLVRDLGRILAGARGLRVLLVGAGGAARGVARPLMASLAAELVIANRTPDRAVALAESLDLFLKQMADNASGQRPACKAVTASEFDRLDGPFDLVINATSAGLTEEVPAIPAAVVADSICYDMVYGRQTAFCRWSLASGAAEAEDGLGMLVEQAALAFELWRGVLPESGAVLTEMRRELMRRGAER